MQHARTTTLAALAALTLISTPALAGGRSSDLDGDGAIDARDLVSMLSTWGPCDGCPQDLNGNGGTDLGDMKQLLESWAGSSPYTTYDCPQPFSDTELQQIGLEALGPQGELNLTNELYERIERDVTDIRTQFGLEGYLHTCAWVGREMLVGVDPDGPLDDFEALNEYYSGTIVNSWFGGTILHLEFPCTMNMPALGAIYEAQSEVNYAEPNGTVGGASNRWVPAAIGGGVWQWTVTISFLDCFDGCDCYKQYVFRTTVDGVLTLVSESGIEGLPYCPDEVPPPPGPDEVEAWEALCNY